MASISPGLQLSRVTASVSGTVTVTVSKHYKGTYLPRPLTSCYPRDALAELEVSLNASLVIVLTFPYLVVLRLGLGEHHWHGEPSGFIDSELIGTGTRTLKLAQWDHDGTTSLIQVEQTKKS